MALHRFFAWFEGLAWQPAVLFLVAFCVAGFIVILLVDLAARRFEAWRERRGIRERNWLLRQQRVQLILDAQREREAREAEEAAEYEKRLRIRVWRDRVQQNREAKQFHVPAGFRDMKGLTKL